MAQADDIVTQVRLDIAELKGMVNVVINEHTRRISEQESASKQLRIDLTTMQTQITTNQANITDMKADISEVVERQMGQGLRFAAYSSPIIAVLSLIISIYMIAKR